MKQCVTCGQEKPLDSFYKNSGTKDGLDSKCKECAKEYAKAYYHSHKEVVSKKYSQYRMRNRQYHLDRCKKWRSDNKEKYENYYKTYAIERQEEIRARRRRYQRAYTSTAHGRVSMLISRYIRHVLKGQKKGKAWESLVGYTKVQLVKHLKKTMPDGYSWQDFMNGRLHIDHKIPIVAFNFKTPEDLDFKKCWALKNLQLLPARKNLQKQAKIDKPFQPSFAFGGAL